MKFRSAFLGSLLVVSTIGTSLLAVADDAQPSASAPILLSKPTTGIGTGDSVFNKLDDPFKTTSSLFGKGNSGSSDVLPPPPMPNYRPAEERKNWILMTPEEILGVKTPEDILGIKSSKDSSYLSQEQKFLERENKSSSLADGKHNDNNPNGAIDLRHWSDDDGKSGSAASSTKSGIGPFQGLSGLLGDDGNRGALFQMGGNASQANGNLAMPSPAQVAKEKADMDNFRALLGEQVDKGPDNKSANANDFNQTLGYRPKASDSDDSDPFANHNGVGVKPLSAQLSKPVGLEQPSIWSHPKKKEEPPSWAPKPPPWLSQGPTLDGIPQRKF